jgi:N-acetylneuraminic acid mutarotase
MTDSHMRPLALALSFFALASCSDPSTAPETDAASSTAIPAFAAASNSWVSRTDMPSTERWGLATTVVTNSAGQSILYAVGGKTATGGSLSKVQAYNVATNTWTYKASLPIPLYWTNGIGVIGGKLYISGGLSGNKEYQGLLYVYDPATNKWTRKRDMPNSTFRGVTGVIQNQLYVVTGCDQEDCWSYEPVAFYRYNPATNLWTALPKPPNQHGWGMGGIIGGKFYVTGGSNQLDVYDPVTNRWTTRAPMPLRRWLGAGATMAGKLYVIGGYQQNSDGSITPGVRTMSVYDAATNTWSTKAPLPAARWDVSASRVVLNGQTRIELVGGRRPGNNLAYVP